MPVRITMLPGLRIIASAGDVTALAGRRLPQALLVYLAVERSAPRDSLLNLLWPDRDDERARHSLSQALHELRRELGEDCIDATGSTVTVGAGVETDLQRFEAAAEAARWAEAVQLYGGAFLEGVHLAGTHAFEEWVDRRRAQAARLHRRARREAVAERLRAQDVAGALAVAQRWAELEPLDDEAQQRTIELLAQTGRRTDALEHYGRFRELLRREELEPMAELEQLAATLAAARMPPPTGAALAAAGAETATGPGPGTDDALVPAAPAPGSASLAEAVSPTAVPGPEPDERAIPGGPGWRARDLAIGAGAGLLIGAPTALLAASVLHAITPRAMPIPFGAGALALAAAIALAASALILPSAWRWRAGRPGDRVRRERTLGPTRRLGAGVGFTLGVLVTLTTAYALAPREPLPHSPGKLAQAGGTAHAGWRRTRIVVTPFLNRAGDPVLEPTARLADDWVRRRLASIAEAEIVGFAAPGAVDTSMMTVTQLARQPGADLVLFGSVYREGGDVLLTARVVPPTGGRLPRELGLQPIGPVRVPLSRPVAGAERLAALVAGAVAAECRSPECAPGRHPPTYEARRVWLDAHAAYSERADEDAAMAGFRQAIALDSTFVNAYTALANHYLTQGRCQSLDSIGDILESRREDFADYDLLYMRAMRATCRNDLDGAYRFRREALGLAPDVAGAQWGVAEAALASGRLREAEQRMRALEKTWYRGQIYLYSGLTEVLHLQGRIVEELQVAEEGRRRQESGYSYMLGLRGLAALGRTADIEARFAEGRRGQARYVPTADLYRQTAAELAWHGHEQAARQFAARALQEFDRLPLQERASPKVRVARVLTLFQLGRWAEARRSLDALDFSSATADMTPGTMTGARAMQLALRGVAAARMGDAGAARAALAAIDRLPGSAALPPKALPREACDAAVLAALGDRAEALRTLADGQARGTVPRSAPRYLHAEILARDLWHDPAFERLFAARD